MLLDVVVIGSLKTLRIVTGMPRSQAEKRSLPSLGRLGITESG
jgi:hypothetical protein